MSLMKQRISLKRTGIFSARTATTALLNAPAKVSRGGASQWAAEGEERYAVGLEGEMRAGRIPWEAAWMLLVFLCV